MNEWNKREWFTMNEMNELMKQINEWMNEFTIELNVERTSEWMKRMNEWNEWSNWHCSFCTHCSFAYKTLLYMYHDVCILFENEMNESYSKMKWMNEWMNEWNVALRVWINVAKEILPRNQITRRTTARTVDCLHQHSNNIRDASWRNHSTTLRQVR